MVHVKINAYNESTVARPKSEVPEQYCFDTEN